MRTLLRPALPALLFALLLPLVAASPASAQYFGRNKVQYQDFNFKQLDTEHFDIYFYERERQAAEDAARMAERWYLRHTQTFLRQFDEEKPLIFYANDADFQQTNVIRGLIGQGTGGVTESLKERVVMPFGASYAQTNHVLGHELVHSFQYDIGLRNQDTGFQLGRLPLWLVEGMAEYLSVGRVDPHTAMWLRDYALREDLPTIEQLTESFRYFPYRFGQAYMAYIGGKYGDPAVTNLFKLAGRVGVDSSFVYALGITADSLSQEWRQAVRSTYLPLMEGRTRLDEFPDVILGEPGERSQLNVSPVVSPDGEYVAFFAQRDLFTINLFIADAETGEIVQELQGTTANPHFDALRFINSAGSWSPDGRKFAFIIFAEGDNQIAIVDVASGDIERRIAVDGVGAMLYTAWSPEGDRIAFTGIEGGLSNLYLLNLETNEVRQLTDDRYADLQPTWSPDGQTLAFATDRGPSGSNFEILNFAPLRIGLMDLDSRRIRILRPFPGADHWNPAYSPDGESVYFISNYNGFKDIFRYALDEEQAYQVTNLATGVSGISNVSPAMSVARQSGRMMFSAFTNGGYAILSRGPAEVQGTPVEQLAGIPTAGILPPVQAVGEGLVSAYLDDPLAGLPAQERFATEPYDPTLTLDFIAPPTVGVGVSTGGAFGTQAGVAGGVAFFFSDLLGDRSLTVVAQANGTFRDIGGQVVYLNRDNRFNYGASAGHIPIRYGRVRGNRFNYVRLTRRIFIDQASLLGAYPLTTTRRFEFNAGAVRYGFNTQAVRCVAGLGGGRRCAPLEDVTPDSISQALLADPDPFYFFQGGAAYVGDFSYFGFTSPVQGGRYRFGVSPRIGTFSYVQGLADYRRYFFFNPLTFAVRGLHIGNYGAQNVADEEDIFGFVDEYLGAAYRPGFLRGYSFNSFDAEGCALGQCTAIAERLSGTHIALASAELRLPVLGVEQFGLLNFPYLPTQLVLFADAGVAWTADQPPVFAFETDPAALRDFEPVEESEQCIEVPGPEGPEERCFFTEISTTRYPLFSVGTAARFNLLGALVFEVYLAYPFQRPGKGWHWGLRLVPGW